MAEQGIRSESRQRRIGKHAGVSMLFVLLTWLSVGSTRAASETGAGITAPGSVDTATVAQDAALENAAELNESSGLDDYQAYAAAHNPELQAARLRWLAARERIPQAKALPDPQLGYSLEDMGGFGSLRHRFEVSQMFPWFGKRELGGAQASLDTDIAGQEYRGVKLQLDREVAESYADYYFLAREIEVNEENLKLLGYLERVAQTRYTAGSGSQSDVVRAQVEMGVLEERLQSLRDMTRPSAATLNSLLNRPADDPLPLPDGLPATEMTVGEEQLRVWLLENNPALNAENLMVERERKGVDLAKLSRYPDLMVGFGLGASRDELSGTMESPGNSYMGMLSLNIPIWGRKNRAAVNEARGMQKAAAQERDNRERSLEAEFETAMFRYRDADRKVRLYRDSLLPKARQSLAVSQRAFEVGAAAFLDIVDAQRMLIELELSLERAQADKLIQHAAIAQITGVESLDAPSDAE